MTSTDSGGCRCGAVRYEAEGDALGAGHRYCVGCRKSSATGQSSNLAVSTEGLAATRELRVFDAPADGGNVVSRGFCPACGSPIHRTQSGMPPMAFVSASSLGDPEQFQSRMSVYARRAPSWHPVVGDLPGFSEMPPAAAMPAGEA